MTEHEQQRRAKAIADHVYNINLHTNTLELDLVASDIELKINRLLTQAHTQWKADEKIRLNKIDTYVEEMLYNADIGEHEEKATKAAWKKFIASLQDTEKETA